MHASDRGKVLEKNGSTPSDPQTRDEVPNGGLGWRFSDFHVLNRSTWEQNHARSWSLRSTNTVPVLEIHIVVFISY